MRLTKTEEKVLRVAFESTKSAVAATQTVDRGLRTVTAIRSLATKGLLDNVRSHTEWEFCRGRTTLYSTVVATITDLGRQTLETNSCS